MGANILANLVGYEGEDCFLDAACTVCGPIKMWEAGKCIKSSLFGMYDQFLG